MKSPGLPSVSSAPAPPPLPAEPKQQSESKGINPWSILLAVIVTSSITGLVGLFLLAVIGAIGIAGGLIALQVIFFLAGNTPLPNGPRTAIESNKNGVRR
jgi:hypothetical protein